MMAAVGRAAELHVLEPSTCLALLATQGVGRLIVPGDDPVVVVVNYAADGRDIVFRSAPGPRVDALDGTPVVFEADAHDVRSHSGWSVVARGTARHVDPPSTEGGERDVAPLFVEPWAPIGKTTWVCITIEEITGRLLRGHVPATWVNPEGYM